MAKASTKKQKSNSTSGLGMVGGAAAGAATGAMLGPVSAAIGALAGGIAGANASKIAKSKPVQRLTSAVRSTAKKGVSTAKKGVAKTKASASRSLKKVVSKTAPKKKSGSARRKK